MKTWKSVGQLIVILIGLVVGAAEADELQGNGSGFFVTESGYFLTNHHVIDGGKRFEVKVGTQTHSAQVVKSDPLNDVAILKVTGKDFKSVRCQGSRMTHALSR